MLKTNPDLEQKLLAGLLQNKSLLDTLSMPDTKIKEATFSAENFQNLFRILHSHFIKYHESLTKDILSQYLERANTPEFNRLQILGLYLELSSLVVDLSGFKFMVDELSDLSLQRKLEALFNKSKTDLETTGGVNVLSKLEFSLSELRRDQQLIPIKRSNLVDDAELRKQQYLDRKIKPATGFLFGYRELDELTGGLQREEVAVIAGRLKSGKSRLLFNMGYNMAMRGTRVMYFSLEMYLDQVQRLYDSRASGLSNRRLKGAKLTDLEEQFYFQYLEQLKNGEKNFYLLDIPRGCTASVLESELDLYEKLMGKPADVIIIDYLSLVNPVKPSDNLSVHYGRIIGEIRQIARSRRLGVLTGSQITRSSIKDTEMGAEHLALSDQIGWTADLVLGIQQSKTEKAANVLTCKVLAYRDGASIEMKWVVDHDRSYIGDLDSEIYKPKSKLPPQVFPGSSPFPAVERPPLIA